MPRGVSGNSGRGTIKHDKTALVQVKREGLTHAIDTFKKGLEVYARLLANKGVRIIFRGMQCYTTGTNIVIPELSLLERPNMNAEEVEEAKNFLEAVRGFVCHEVGHILYTDFDAVKDAMMRKNGALVKEVWNALEDAVIERKMVNTLHGTTIILDNLNEWAQRRVMENFAKNDVTLLTKVVMGVTIVAKNGTDHWFYQQLPEDVKKILKKLGPEIAATRAIQNSWETLAVSTQLLDKIEKLINPPPPPPPPPPQKADDEEEEDAKKGDGDDESEEDDREDDAVGSSSEDDDGDGESEGDEGEDDDRDDKDDADDSHGDDEEGEGDDADDKRASGSSGGDEDDEGSSGGSSSLDEGDDFSDDEEKKPTSAAGGAEDDETEKDSEEDDLDESTRNKLKDELEHSDKAAEDLKETDAARQIEGAVKNHVDPNATLDRYVIYTTEYDENITPVIDDTARRSYADLVKSLRDPVAAGKRQLANLLKARTLSHTAHDLEEGTLDRTRLYRFATRGDPRIFKETVERTDLKGVAAVMMINLSGSMLISNRGRMLHPGWARRDPGERSRLELAQEAAVIFGECLSAVNIPFEIFGHSTTKDEGHLTWSQCPEEQRPLFTRWGGTVFETYKTFEEEWAKAAPRVMKAAFRQNTHDAEAVQFAAQRLLGVKDLKRRIVFMLDDGEPFPNIWAPGHMFISNDPDFAAKEPWIGKHQEALRRMVKRVEGLGVEVIGLGMADDSVQHYYKDHIVVNDTSEFSRIFIGKLKTILLPKAKRA